VGKSGATGRVTGPHLHWGARVGEAIFDPRALLDPRLFGQGGDDGAKPAEP
jgi:murein DD-endopeptidase MepM/ murein hydrolase activator NlpD